MRNPIATLRSLFIGLALSAILLLAGREDALAVEPALAQPVSFVPNRVLVKFRAQTRATLGSDGTLRTGQAALDRLLSQSVQRAAPLFGAPPRGAAARLTQSFANRGLSRVYRLQLKTGSDVRNVAATLARDPNVEYAEPDYIAKKASPPNDPRYGEQWGLAKIQIEGAWAVTTGTPAIVIAVVDSGIALSHPDLQPNLWINPGEIAGNGIDDDGNGFIDDVNGWNFVAGTNNVSDDNGHGTLVAGVVAARRNNGIGIAGVCGNCRIMPVKVMQSTGVANYSDIAAGVTYATNKGARVIELALGGYSDSKTLRDATAYALLQNIPAVAGAGNDNTGDPFYPAAYSGVIAVAGTTSTDTRMGVSNFGTWISVSAPGENILSTASGGDYALNSGTSMASAFAAGLAGLLLAQHGDWTPAMVRSQLMHTADSIDSLNPGYEGKLGAGRLNATQAVEPAVPILTFSGYSANGVANGRPDFGKGLNLNVGIHNDWADASSVNATLSTTDPFVSISRGTASYGTILSGSTVTNTTSYSMTIAAGAGYNHAIPFQLHLTASGGYATDLSFTVTTRSSSDSVQGTIASDTTWTNDKTYLVTGETGIAPGVTLTIEPGTTVKFNGNYALSVGGTLIADGTPSQPIVFMPNSTGTWNRIYFDDPSTDAVATGDGTYQSGSILRHVQVQGAVNGVVCNAATPYLSHLALSSGSIDCTPGGTPLWILDSAISSLASYGTTHVWRSTTSGNLGLGTASEVLMSTVGGAISGKSGTVVRSTTVNRGIAITGSGTVENSTVLRGATLGAGSLVRSKVAGGDVTVTSGSVLSNTITLGRIIAGSGSTIQGNSVEDAAGVGIQTSGTVNVIGNRIVGSSSHGMVVSAGLVQGNLIADSMGDGLQVGAATVVNNTLTRNRGRTIYVNGGTPVKIESNNLESNLGQYDLYNNTTTDVNAQSNWWGTTDPTTLAARIFDFNKDYHKGHVNTAPVLTAPSPNVPAYVRNVTISPDDILGIQTGVFSVEFSRPMDTSTRPALGFYTTRRGVTTQYGMPSQNNVTAFAAAPDGTMWAGTMNGLHRFNGTGWTSVSLSGSGLTGITAMAFASDGSLWAGGNTGAARLSGTAWTPYNKSNSGLPNNKVYQIKVTSDGAIWFATDGGLARLQGTTWTAYKTSNSGLPSNQVYDIAVDLDGAKWLVTGNGVARFDGVNWRVYNPSNSGLPSVGAGHVAIDRRGTKWFLTSSNVTRFDGSSWTVYGYGYFGCTNTYLSTIVAHPSGGVFIGTSLCGASQFDGTTWKRLTGGLFSPTSSIGVGNDGTLWFGTYLSGSIGITRLYWGLEYSITTSPTWTDSSHYRASAEISALVPRGTYSITVSSAVGGDGILIAPNSNITFTVDYGGAVTDKTPPSTPVVNAESDGSLSKLIASWSSGDKESGITLYQYAIGTKTGGTDVVNWTNINGTSLVRSGLNLLQGQKYYISVKARNGAGLWSAVGVSNPVVAGVAPIKRFLPFIMR